MLALVFDAISVTSGVAANSPASGIADSRRIVPFAARFCVKKLLLKIFQAPAANKTIPGRTMLI